MDPKTVLETGKATAELLKAVLEFIGAKSISPSESNRLMSYYLAVQAYLEVQDDYFRFLEKLTSSSADAAELLWQAKKLSHLMASRHYEAYSLADGLDFRIRAHETTLHDLIKVYKMRVSKSLGFGPKDVMVASAYKSVASIALKRKHFLSTYNISAKEGVYNVGELIVGDNVEYRRFVDYHEESSILMHALVGELDNAVGKLVFDSDKRR